MPLRDAVEYVAAAYIVVFALVLIYLTIMSKRLRGVQRDLDELTRLADERLNERLGGSGREGGGGLGRENDGGRPSPPHTDARTPDDHPELDLGRPESTVA